MQPLIAIKQNRELRRKVLMHSSDSQLVEKIIIIMVTSNLCGIYTLR